MLDVVKIEIGYEKNMWAHYPPLSEDDETA